ncbi:MAG TPA: bifunctional proline dehydrogenase/L-glutamate gamma-semialdehyde dehydrogenase [Acidimicrobiales bacterium]|nr:bifunctional proline dehydrogenase/L-glutamate gamma-semialdehyde dehydrogenase [Acidimicrobiales bacterium]
MITDPSLDQLTNVATERARILLEDATSLLSRRERAARRRFARLLRDRDALGVTVTLTDEVMRFTSRRRAAAALRDAVRHASVAGFGWWNFAGLRVVGLLSRVAPGPVLALVHRRIRYLTSDLIIDADARTLRRHLQHRRRHGLGANVNVLGEAVLGEAEAGDRLDRVVEMMSRPEVTYVSVKLSSVVSQLVTVDRAGSVHRVSSQLRSLYRASARDGVFVNLDMEEFRDLRLTMDAFCGVLSEPEFLGLSAGVVLQAYLPDVHAVLDELLAWAFERHARGGATIKVRLVKGANLAMEHAEAEIHGWTAAPYGTKADADASYARLLDVVLRPQWSSAVRVGVASHNLFHLAWALEVARARGVTSQVDVEMLEGMANAEALALARSGETVLLYTPATQRDDFASAVAYLVRRLEENTAPENYLSAAFAIGRDVAVFEEQRRRFVDSIAQRHDLSVASRRFHPPTQYFSTFENARDGDPADPDYAQAAARALADRSTTPSWVGEPASDYEEGRDPGAAGAVWYRYAVADLSSVDSAVAAARVAGPSWEARGSVGRAEVLARVAQVVASRRTQLLAVMARDTGKTLAEGDPEVSEGIDFIHYYAERGCHLGDSTPLGVVVVVPPWNFPWAIPTGGVAAALAAGNAVILKPAPEAVATGFEVASAFWDGGVPRDVLQFVPTRDDEVGRHLVTHTDVDAVILTGSFDTARLFNDWRPEINLLAETSGKNAIVVTACADVDLAVRDLVTAAFGHAGQKCSAASLGIVEASLLADPAFLRQLRDAVTSLRVGRATDVATVVGPVIRPPEAALTRALTHLDEGEQWLVEPRALDEHYLWQPGVKLGVRPGSWSHLNEWFGPVLGIMTAPDLATATRWQSQVPYGLTAGLHSLSTSECEYWLEHVAAGNLYVNRTTTGAVVNRQPFGGWKRSAVGPTAKTGGPHYVNALRRWRRVDDLAAAQRDLSEWWTARGAVALDPSGLRVERNVHRYRRPHRFIVRVDDGWSSLEASYLERISSVLGVEVETSAGEAAKNVAIDVRESPDAFVERCSDGTRVRWLSAEPAPTERLLERGVSVDRRALAQAGDVEGPRWLLEQSVSVTNHRYGNVGVGPRPHVPGLGEA